MSGGAPGPRRLIFLDDDSEADETPTDGIKAPSSSDDDWDAASLGETSSFVSDSSVEIDPASDFSDGNRGGARNFLDDDDDDNSELDISLTQILDGRQCRIDREYSNSDDEPTDALKTDFPGCDAYDDQIAEDLKDDHAEETSQSSE
jgi:hypothetical protein